jgi:DHA1 family tetracycline resistance protein-like MFS transporter
MFYAWMIVFTFGGVANPAMSAILSEQVGPDQQGELQGVIASITSLTSVGAPLLMTSLLAWFSGPHAPVYFPGAAFMMAALCELGGLMLFALARARLS